MTNNCLVLAFETPQDLPKNSEAFSHIDVYGINKMPASSFLPDNLTIYNQFFEIDNYHKVKTPYVTCFIRHPDPWGEPRNWIQAIAALGECLKGSLQCEFWFPHEIIAFHYLLEEVLGTEKVKYVEAKEIDSIGYWKNYKVRWEINDSGVKKNMLDFYKKYKVTILQKFYSQKGRIFDSEISIDEVADKLKTDASQEIIQELLQLTIFIKDEYNLDKEKPYEALLEGIARKSYYYLYSLEQLVGNYDNGDTVIDLSRSLFESLIVLNFIQEFGADKKAKDFFMYTPVERHHELDYIAKIGIETTLPADKIAERKEEFEIYKDEFSRLSPKEKTEKEAKKSIKVLEKMGILVTDKLKSKFIELITQDKDSAKEVNRTWAGIDIDQMMIELDKRGKLPGNLKHNFEQTYIFGNRKNHLSPSDIEILLDKEQNKANQEHNMSIGLFISILSSIKIFMELVKLRKDENLLKKLQVLEDQLLNT